MIKVITGAMFSGKSYRLIELIKELDENTIEIFKPNIDTRDKGIIKSRDSEETYSSFLIDDLNEIPDYIDDKVKTIIIDEAQLLTGNISIILDLHLKGYDFIISGLNLTSERKPFGLMKDILCVATDIEILKAKCICCDRINADYTYSIKNKKEDILIGEFYVPICRECLERKILNER
mgnify:CR=1 FL=1